MKREWIKRAKRALVLLLAVVLIGQVVDWRTVALRASVCPNHTEHDESCGYVAASDGHPCNHEHDASCGYEAPTEGHPCNHSCEQCSNLKGPRKFSSRSNLRAPHRFSSRQSRK